MLVVFYLESHVHYFDNMAYPISFEPTHNPINKRYILTQCGLVMPYCHIDLSQRWFMYSNVSFER